jgi:hypothetical protein
MKPVILFICIGWIFLSHCINPVEQQFADANSKEGFQLAKQYCQSCHLLPKAGDLDKNTWGNFVLPKMGLLLGFQSMGMNRYITKAEKPVVTMEEWEKIRHHFITEASAELTDTSNRKIISLNLDSFEIIPGPSLTQHPLTTYIGYQPANGQLIVGDGMKPAISLSAPNVDSAPANLPVGVGVSHVITDSLLYVLTMGVLQPSDSRLGKLVAIDPKTAVSRLLLDSLQRPVHFVMEDLNQDGKKDIVVAEFGNQTGQLSWFEQLSPVRFRKHTLRAVPGAIRIIVTDWNQDGWMDVLVLMAQGDEGVFLYENQGGARFAEKTLLRFPAVHGSNYLELLDYNKDGLSDLLVTNGDNGDYPPVMKPYHGIRIFENRGEDQFEQVVFLPMNGVGKAMSADFNEDGHLDIAAISFFPDLANTPEEAFIFWKGEGRGNFQPMSFPEAKSGNWLTMDCADVDADGDKDILLGQASFGLHAEAGGPGGKQKSSWVWIKNRLR